MGFQTLRILWRFIEKALEKVMSRLGASHQLGHIQTWAIPLIPWDLSVHVTKLLILLGMISLSAQIPRPTTSGWIWHKSTLTIPLCNGGCGSSRSAWSRLMATGDSNSTSPHCTQISFSKTTPSTASSVSGNTPECFIRNIRTEPDGLGLLVP